MSTKRTFCRLVEQSDESAELAEVKRRVLELEKKVEKAEADRVFALNFLWRIAQAVGLNGDTDALLLAFYGPYGGVSGGKQPLSPALSARHAAGLLSAIMWLQAGNDFRRSDPQLQQNLTNLLIEYLGGMSS